MHKSIAFFSLVLSTAPCWAQSAEPTDWISPRLSTEVSVTASKAHDQYVVRAKIVDLVSAKIIGTPVLLVAGDKPATVEIGSVPGVKLKMVFTVSPDGKTAAFTSETRRNGELESAQKATLVVASGA